MADFKSYIESLGISPETAIKYESILKRFLTWMKNSNLTLKQFNLKELGNYQKYLEEYFGNGKKTIKDYARIVAYYYDYKGLSAFCPVENNSIRVKRQLPPSPITLDTLKLIYNAFENETPIQSRNKALVGLMAFQGLIRSELEELRITDINFDNRTIYVAAQQRTNSRILKLSSEQLDDLSNYLNQHRNFFMQFKADNSSDRVFLSQGSGNTLNNALALLYKKIKAMFPEVTSLRHLRFSAISNYITQFGLMEAKVRAGYRYIDSVIKHEIKTPLKKEFNAAHPLNGLF